MQIVILAGGFGTRMSEETDFIPKPMAIIGNKPILWHLVKYYYYHGFREFIICSGYKSEIIKKYFQKYSDLPDLVNVKVVFTGKKSNTGERIRRIKKYVKNDFMLTYGDGLSNVNLKKLIQTHSRGKNIVTLTAVKPEPRFGKLILKKKLVHKFSEKKNSKEDWINGGFMICSINIFNFIKKNNSIFEKDVLNILVKKRKLGAYKHTGFWHPIDTLKDKRYANNLWKKKKAPWKLWRF
jgi:glucose-1-phosphate cytidylyltransferase